MLPVVKNLIRPLTLLIVILHAVYMLAGCGADDDIEEKVLPVKIVSVDPPSGNTIAVDAIITATFDGVPSDVIVSHGVAAVEGKILAIAGPFTFGTLNLTITWADGTQTLTYTVPIPDTEAPQIIGGTVKDGDQGVDPPTINWAGRIEIEFSEKVSGNIDIKDKSGRKIIWLGEFEGTKGILTLVKGYELQNSRTYIIEGKAVDAAGNSTDFKITFETEFCCGLIVEDQLEEPEGFP